ncbi:MAG: DUF2946 family protein [Xanthobacteraceae bacterium]|nr:DUF2946 family protein [Xanthobacteraceae bacterium]
MTSILARLRDTTLRALVAWTVAFGLVFQMLVPVVAAQAKAQDPLAVAGVICAAHAEAQSGDPSQPPADKDLNDCCSICALLHAAKLAVPPVAAPAIVLKPTTSSRLEGTADQAPHAAAAPVPYSSRAPPLAA